jgi:hypothetical protein
LPFQKIINLKTNPAMKKLFYSLAILLCLFSNAHAQIPSVYFGLNGWMPDREGDDCAPGNNMSPQIVSHMYGNLYDIIDNYTSYLRDECRTRLMRYGGTSADVNIPSDAEYIQFVDKCINVLHAEPVLQVSYAASQLSSHVTCTTGTYTASYYANYGATQIVNLMSALEAQGYYVKYWIIGNEPDLYHSQLGIGSTDYDAAKIASYFKPIAEAMKAHVYGMPEYPNGIQIIGPELAYFDYQNSGNVMEKLLTSTNNNENITRKIIDDDSNYAGDPNDHYLDIASFHTYPLNTSTYTEGDVIAQPANSFQPQLTQMQTYLASGSNHNPNLKVAVTEFNLSYNNLNSATLNNTSFLAGQWMADMYSTGMKNGVDFMCSWSVAEGNPGWGLLNNTDYSKRSTYWHTDLLSNHFWGTYQSPLSVPATNVKTFASVEGAGFYVMVLNQSSTDYDTYELCWDNGGSCASGQDITFSFNFNSFGMPFTTHHYTSAATGETIKAHSTVLLQIDCNGQMLDRIDYVDGDDHPNIVQVGNILINPDVALCDTTGISGTINTNTTYYADTVHVSGDTYVDNALLTIDSCIVIFNKGAVLYGKPHSRIKIANSVLVGCSGSQWEGINMHGTHSSDESLSILSSAIINARKAVTTDSVFNLVFSDSYFVNGDTAMDLISSKDFTLYNNVMAGYDVGVKTLLSIKNSTLIKENHFLEINTDISSSKDAHDSLEISCNEFHYRDYAILSDSTQLGQQGSALQSAGNLFIQEKFGQPENYLDHIGNLPTYYYGPSQATAFSYSNVMNVPIVMAASDKVCKTVKPVTCPLWIGISEQTNPVSQMLIYPNPNNGTFTVELPENSQETTIVIFDMLGKEIMKQKISAHTQKTVIALNESKGFYFVQFATQGKTISKKLIVE